MYACISQVHDILCAQKIAKKKKKKNSFRCLESMQLTVVKILVFKIYSYNVWHENDWILLWKF